MDTTDLRVDTQLTRLGEIVEAMHSLSSSGGGGTGGAQLARRYRDVHLELRAAHRKQVSARTLRRESAALLGRVGGERGRGEGDAQAQLLRERSSLASHHREIDAVLENAGAIREALARQRSGIASSLGLLGGLAGRLPGVSAVVDAIKKRRSRNDYIVAGVAAFCSCALLYFTVLRKV